MLPLCMRSRSLHRCTQLEEQCESHMRVEEDLVERIKLLEFALTQVLLCTAILLLCMLAREHVHIIVYEGGACVIPYGMK